MANNKKKNPLNFTSLDYDGIRNQIQNYVNRDPRFENFRDSAIAQTILDLFAGTTDLSNYYIERVAEENYFDTARLKSSVIALSKILGYVPRRPVPAESAVSIILKGPLPAIATGDTVTFQKHITNFTSLGLPFILKNSYTYTFTSADSAQVGNPEYEKVIEFAVKTSASDDEILVDVNGDVDPSLLLDIEIMQGSIEVEAILGSVNSQVGKLFQSYKIEDPKFSNYYGNEDVAFNKVTGEVNLDENLTKLGIGLNQVNAFNTLYTIDRKTLIDPNILNPDDSTIPKRVLLQTNQEEGINILFGDDIFATKGLNSSDQNVYIQYLQTEGKKANQTGIIGVDVVSPNTFKTSDNVDITSNITFKFTRNIANGSDLESIDSIKLNSPKLFFSLDRLVTKADYVAYLKTQTIGATGGEIKNALAWGEQEEITGRNQLANFRFFNVAFFSPLGSLYKFPIDQPARNLNDEELHEAFLEEESDFSTIAETSAGIVSADGYPEQAYFNVMVKESPQPEVKRVSDFRVLNPDHPISEMYDKLDARAQMTVKHIYISPIVQKFKLKGRVTIGKLEDRSLISKKVNNKIYEYLDDIADFNINIDKSNITDIIQGETEVINSNIYFEPVVSEKLITTLSADQDIASSTDASNQAQLESIINTQIYDYLTSAGYARIHDSTSLSTSGLFHIFEESVTSAVTLGTSGTTPKGIWNNPHTGGSSSAYQFEDKAHYVVGSINEKTFYQILMKGIYDNVTTSGVVDVGANAWGETQFFKNFTFKLHNDLVGVIRTAMIDSEGNITNYSLNNEIAQVEVDLSYQFAT